ncbi:uncharacterized protein LOC143210604 isoform X1 [Lasioglossum baleicum]|uniref:uncharacterized protein LOC143210604 isoform X1 n=1 Tax=Lasioglossum baleicum TaxID=434251 RepID=UPI003FCCAFCF
MVVDPGSCDVEPSRNTSVSHVQSGTVTLPGVFQVHEFGARRNSSPTDPGSDVSRGKPKRFVLGIGSASGGSVQIDLSGELLRSWLPPANERNRRATLDGNRASEKEEANKKKPGQSYGLPGHREQVYQGHECLLRAICETSEHTLRHNGLIGDILHVIFTPTSSRHEELPQDILQAEVVGRNGGCSKYQPQCPVGLFDLIGVLG